MKRLPKLSCLACALAFAAGLSLPALADSHHFGMKHQIRAEASVSRVQDQAEQ
jgi:hypothetical protein